MYFSLAPLAVKRDIAVLGLIHRSTLRRSPDCFFQFFRVDVHAPGRYTRKSHRHSKHLHDPCGVYSQEFLLRSPLGAIRLYNILPDAILAQNTVKDFQSMLQTFLKERVTRRDSNWLYLLSWRQHFAYHPFVPLPELASLNELFVAHSRLQLGFGTSFLHTSGAFVLVVG